MRLIKGRKRCKCKNCGAYVWSGDLVYVAEEGRYCYKCGRIKSLHDGFMIWLRGFLNAKV